MVDSVIDDIINPQELVSSPKWNATWSIWHLSLWAVIYHQFDWICQTGERVHLHSLLIITMKAICNIEMQVISQIKCRHLPPLEWERNCHWQNHVFFTLRWKNKVPQLNVLTNTVIKRIFILQRKYLNKFCVLSSYHTSHIGQG